VQTNLSLPAGAKIGNKLLDSPRRGALGSGGQAGFVTLLLLIALACAGFLAYMIVRTAISVGGRACVVELNAKLGIMGHIENIAITDEADDHNHRHREPKAICVFYRQGHSSSPVVLPIARTVDVRLGQVKCFWCPSTLCLSISFPKTPFNFLACSKVDSLAA